MAAIPIDEVVFPQKNQLDDAGMVFFWNGRVFRDIHPAGANEVHRARLSLAERLQITLPEEAADGMPEPGGLSQSGKSRWMVEHWHHSYNQDCPYSSLDSLTPHEFLLQWNQNQPGRKQPLFPLVILSSSG